MLYLTSQGRRNTIHLPPPPVYRDPDKFLKGQKLARIHLRLLGTHGICTVACKRVAQVKNSSDKKFVRTRVNGISESREHLKYFWAELFKVGLK